jgi:hypothetical protein
LVSLFFPSITNLANSWGSITINSSIT